MSLRFTVASATRWRRATGPTKPYKPLRARSSSSPTSEAQTDLGHLYRSLGYLDEAIRLFKTAIASGANTANAHNNLGALLFAIGKFDEAIVHLTEALKQKPELAEAHNNLGNAFRETGRIDAAVRHYQEALRLKPGYAGALSKFCGHAQVSRQDRRGHRELSRRYQPATGLHRRA
jgi:tetratricopeptide (TPR) repeat protein